ncbi:hypothetical protein E2C01_022256 [Portunus trituberculatus]|uniref:Uncharacterized protein n=1 Tax=Portunus trituberculatus TaxID=210409 RepID=A0A5B7E6J6_PORTR|nr:hypothetical protein [Portunus trituberculatus]
MPIKSPASHQSSVNSPKKSPRSSCIIKEGVSVAADHHTSFSLTNTHCRTLSFLLTPIYFLTRIFILHSHGFSLSSRILVLFVSPRLYISSCHSSSVSPLYINHWAACVVAAVVSVLLLVHPSAVQLIQMRRYASHLMPKQGPGII